MAMRAAKLRLAARAQSGDVDTDEADPDEPPEPIGIGGFPEGSPEGELYGYVLAKWCSGEWDASDVGTRSYLVTRIDGRGLSQLSVNPSKRGMNQNRKIKKILGIDASYISNTFYFVQVWMHDKWSNRRVQRLIPTRLIFELLEDIATESPEVLDKTGIAGDVYKSNNLMTRDVVQTYGSNDVDPIGLYSD